MLCDEFEDCLNAMLDERARPECDAALREHAEACAGCRQLAAGYGTLLDGLDSLAPLAGPADMAQRVLAVLQVQPVQPRRRWLVGASLATAAALLIAVLPMARVVVPEMAEVARFPAVPAMLEAEQPEPSTPDAASAAAPVMASNVPLEALPLLQTVPGLNGETEINLYAALLRETGSGLASIVLYVPGIGGTRGIIDAEPKSPQEEAPWPAVVSEGLRPVTDSVTDTLSLLWNVLPVDRASRS